MEKKRLGLLGNGFLSGIIARAWAGGLLPDYGLVGICGRTAEKTAALAREVGCAACGSLEELMALSPDYVAEAASVQAVRDGAETVLRGGADLVVLSIGAFADGDFLRRVEETARARDRRVHLASGAVGGFDVLRTVALMGSAQGAMETRKGPGSLRGTPLCGEALEGEERQVFSGSAEEAIGLLPTKVNVAVAAALASVGPARLDFAIHSVPGFVGDDHRITVRGDGVRAVVDVYSSTSAIAAWSVVARLRNLASPIQF